MDFGAGDIGTDPVSDLCHQPFSGHSISADGAGRDSGGYFDSGKNLCALCDHDYRIDLGESGV